MFNFIKINFSKLETIHVLRFSFYICIFLNEIFVKTEGFGAWLPLVAKEIYPFLPDEILNFNFFATCKFLYLLFCLPAAFSFFSKISSAMVFLFGSAYLILFYSTGYSEHHNQLVWHVILVFMLFENFNNFKLSEFITTVRILFLSVFFTAAVTKARSIGFSWFEEKTLRDFLLMQRFYGSGGFQNTGRDLNYWSLMHLAELKYFFYAAFPIEFMAPLAIFKRGHFIVLIIAIMQIYAAFTFHAVFVEYIGIYFFWLLPNLKIRKT